jgi:hypothetical protein
VTLRYINLSESQPVANRDTNEMRVPMPDTVENLLIYLHECAHSYLHRNDAITPNYLKKFQAEIWALGKMQAEGIAVSDALVHDSKTRIVNDIRGAVRS